MKDVRLIATSQPNTNPQTWTELPARLENSNGDFSEKVSVPSGPDSYTVVMQPKHSAVQNPLFGVGIICKRSKGDLCNHHPKVGSGMYLRELDIHATKVISGKNCPD
jgi:hypothetical protein